MLKTLACALVAVAFGLAMLKKALPDAMIVCGDVIDVIRACALVALSLFAGRL